MIGRADDDRLYAFKKGSGLVVGIGDGFTCVSSDLPSILPLTRNVIRPLDGEIVTLWADRVEVRSVEDGSLVDRPVEVVTESMDAVRKGGYAHFMLKEIHEQPQVARELLHLLDASADVAPLVEQMRSARHLYLVGCGTSFHAASVGSVYLAQLAGRVAIPVLAPQFIAQYAPAVGPEDVGIFVSQSGETKDVLNALEAAERRGMTCFGLANVVGSTLTRAARLCLPLGCGYEISVPATKTFTNQVLTFLYLAYRLAGRDTGLLAHVPDLMEETLAAVAGQVEAIADEINAWDNLYCLGYGATYPIALEGALKLKEITYAHCEGMLSTEFKHGPLSAVTAGFPIVFVAGPADIPLIISGINEVKVRGARTITIAEEDPRLRANGDVLVAIPRSDPQVSALLGVLPLQLLSYHMSVLRGFDPDFPRNLSQDAHGGLSGAAQPGPGSSASASATASAWGNARPAFQAASNASGGHRASQPFEVPGELGLLVVGHVGAGGLPDRGRGTQQAGGPVEAARVRPPRTRRSPAGWRPPPSGRGGPSRRSSRGTSPWPRRGVRRAAGRGRGRCGPRGRTGCRRAP